MMMMMMIVMMMNLSAEIGVQIEQYPHYELSIEVVHQLETSQLFVELIAALTSYFEVYLVSHHLQC
jgi:hypothetical protein